MTSYNQSIISMLYEYQKKADNPFKEKAYKKAIKSIKELNCRIETIEDTDGIVGIGKSIRDKIKELIDSKPLINIEDKPGIELIYGIGPAAIKKLNEQGIYYIEDLRNKEDLLNDKQKIGLKYWSELTERIPRQEMDKHAKIISDAIKDYQHSIVGSYRRGADTSGDIDVLIIGNKDTLKEIIRNMGAYIIETLACKDKKFMGIVRLGKGKIARRLDMLVTTPEEFPYAQLYFTGSKDNNVRMRTKAKQMGYRLNEHGMTIIKDGAREVENIRDEKDIFRFLDLEYIEPKNR